MIPTRAAVPHAGDRRGSEDLARSVADFYDRLEFTSRSSHPAYQDLVPDSPGERIGDFGCGDSIFYAKLRSYRPPPTFVDTSAAALRKIDFGLKVRADIRRLPLRTGTYDRVFCIGVVHHLPHPDAAIGELARVLRRDGTLFLGVYAPRTIQKLLRKLYGEGKSRPWRPLLVAATWVMVWARHGIRGGWLGPTDVKKRVADFLFVPHVTFAGVGAYRETADKVGLRLQKVHRISAMNVLEFKNNRSGS
jgi:SAM-dependent methyltransferase